MPPKIVTAVCGRLQSPLILLLPGEREAVNDYSGHGYDSWSAGVAYGADGTKEAPAEETCAHGTVIGTGYEQWQGYDQGYDTGQTLTWDTSLYTVFGDTGLYQQVTEADAYRSGTYDTGVYESSGACPAGAAYGPETTYERDPEPYEFDSEPYPDPPRETAEEPRPEPVAAAEATTAATTVTASTASTAVTTATTVPRSRAANRGGGGSRRRRPAKRSALLTVAVPSVAVMGVAACAAAAVAAADDKEESTSAQAADHTAATGRTVSTKLDQQLAGVSRNADDFADRASRTQERLDLKERQAAERRRKAEEAARKEALRPKFFLPVSQKGLSAYFGQAGVNWMSVHTGIDFPVSYGTPVRAATDGTVRTQWNASYGNMAMVTAADGTVTWYCHLSSAKIRSGTVKAGDVIAYSGNSGNSTGPHLHFEVHPQGGAAMDPLNWLLAKDLDPR